MEVRARLRFSRGRKLGLLISPGLFSAASLHRPDSESYLYQPWPESLEHIGNEVQLNTVNCIGGYVKKPES